MSICGTSVRKLVGVASVVLGLILFSPLRSLGGDAPRPIASLTAQERKTLTGNTLVRLPSGRVTTWKSILDEHHQRMARFTAARQAIALSGKRGAAPPAGAYVAARPPAHNVAAPVPSPTPKGGPTPYRIGGVYVPPTPTPRGTPFPNPTPVPHASPAPTPNGSVVPNPLFGRQNPLPFDYVKACQGTTACLYLPSDATLYSAVDSNGVPQAAEYDWLITDAKTCAEGGGLLGPGYCAYYYPLTVLQNFDPTKMLGWSAPSCNAPLKGQIDNRGAAGVRYSAALPRQGQEIAVNQDLHCPIWIWVSQ